MYTETTAIQTGNTTIMDNPNKYDISLIIPCYNEASILEDSVAEVVQTLNNTSWTYEIIFVDDCSQDKTREIIERLLCKYKDKNFHKVFHHSNTGRGSAVTDGFRIAQGEVVGYIDIDLEVPARYIPSFVAAIRNGADFAIAHRIYDVSPRLFHRFLLSKGYIWLVRNILGIRLKDTEAGFKFFKRAKVLAVLGQIRDKGWFWDTEIVSHFYFKKYKIKEIPCLFLKRHDRKSTVNIVNDSFVYFVKLWKFRRMIKSEYRNQQTL